MRRAAAGKHALLHMFPVDQQAYAVAGKQSQLRESHRCRAGVIEFGVAMIGIFLIAQDAAAQQSSGVENDPDSLVALCLVTARDQLTAPRGCRPANVAQVVAFEIFTQALEVAAQSALPRLA